MLGVQYPYMASIKNGNAAVATLLQYLAPVMIIVYLILSRQSVLTRKDLLTVSLALIGRFFLLTNGSFSQLSVPPLAAVLTTVFWLKEPFGMFQWIGTTCIIIMIFLLAFNKSSSSKTNQFSKNEKPLRIS